MRERENKYRGIKRGESENNKGDKKRGKRNIEKGRERGY